MDNTLKCAVCGAVVEDNYKRCHVCMWDNNDTNDKDGFPIESYKKWWSKLSTVIPPLMKKYNVSQYDIVKLWSFDELKVPRENIKDFINELTNNNIKIKLSFFYLHNDMVDCEHTSFIGRPIIKSNSVKENNDECLNIIFAQDPMAVCKKYKLAVKELVKGAEDKNKFWENVTPAITVVPSDCDFE